MKLPAPGGKKLSPTEFRRRARKIRLFAMDVDGVLTDGSIVILESGEEIKFWNVKDRIGFFMTRRADPRFRFAWITGRQSPQVEQRAAEIGVDALYQKCDHKGKALLEAAEKFNIKPEECLFIGDDLVDLPAFREAGLAVCPADSPEAVKKSCHWVTAAAGGRGVFREAADRILESQGLWEKTLEQFLNPTRRPNP